LKQEVSSERVVGNPETGLLQVVSDKSRYHKEPDGRPGLSHLNFRVALDKNEGVVKAQFFPAVL